MEHNDGRFVDYPPVKRYVGDWMIITLPCGCLPHAPGRHREQDRVGYKILLDANNLRSTCQHGRPGKWASIVIQDEYNESPYEAYEYIYAPVCFSTIPLVVYALMIKR